MRQEVKDLYEIFLKGNGELIFCSIGNNYIKFPSYNRAIGYSNFYYSVDKFLKRYGQFK